MMDNLSFYCMAANFLLTQFLPSPLLMENHPGISGLISPRNGLNRYNALFLPLLSHNQHIGNFLHLSFSNLISDFLGTHIQLHSGIPACSSASPFTSWTIVLEFV